MGADGRGSKPPVRVGKVVVSIACSSGAKYPGCDWRQLLCTRNRFLGDALAGQDLPAHSRGAAGRPSAGQPSAGQQAVVVRPSSVDDALPPSPPLERRREGVPVIRRRDRIHSMLAPLVGPDLAMERANNIAQALMCPQGRVVREVDQMLSNLDLGDSRYVAEEIVRAWQGMPVEPIVEVMVA